MARPIVRPRDVSDPLSLSHALAHALAHTRARTHTRGLLDARAVTSLHHAAGSDAYDLSNHASKLSAGDAAGGAAYDDAADDGGGSSSSLSHATPPSSSTSPSSMARAKSPDACGTTRRTTLHTSSVAGDDMGDLLCGRRFHRGAGETAHAPLPSSKGENEIPPNQPHHLSPRLPVPAQVIDLLL